MGGHVNAAEEEEEGRLPTNTWHPLEALAAPKPLPPPPPPPPPLPPPPPGEDTGSRSSRTKIERECTTESCSVEMARAALPDARGGRGFESNEAERRSRKEGQTRRQRGTGRAGCERAGEASSEVESMAKAGLKAGLRQA